MDYKDFKIRIEGRSGDGYAVSVESPMGEDETVIHLPFEVDEVIAQLQRYGGTVRGETTRKAEIEFESQMSPAEVGAQLYNALFSGPVATLYNRSLGSRDDADQGLRIKLHLNLKDDDVRKLATIPWEFLCEDAETDNFLNLSRKTPIVRYIDAREPSSVEPLTGELRVLVVMPNPEGVATLDLSRERNLIEDSWAKEAAVSVDYLDNPTANDLLEKLSEKDYHVLHFMGHGTPAGLILADENGQASVLAASTIGVWLGDLPSLRLVFLNACDTAKVDEDSPVAGVATKLVSEGLPAVVAMQFPITDAAAIGFARAFYTRLVQGYPVDEAVSQGRKAILAVAADALEWGTPVLFMRAANGQLFETPPSNDDPETHRDSTSLAAVPAPAPRPKGTSEKDAVGFSNPILSKSLLGVLVTVVAVIFLIVFFSSTSSELTFAEDPIAVYLKKTTSARLEVKVAEDETLDIYALGEFQPVEFDTEPSDKIAVGETRIVDNAWEADVTGLGVGTTTLEVIVNKGSDLERLMRLKVNVGVDPHLKDAGKALAAKLIDSQVPSVDLLKGYEVTQTQGYEPTALALYGKKLEALRAVELAREQIVAHTAETLLGEKLADYSTYASLIKNTRGFDLKGSFDNALFDAAESLKTHASAELRVCAHTDGEASSGSCSSSISSLPKGQGASVWFEVKDNQGSRQAFTTKIFYEDGRMLHQWQPFESRSTAKYYQGWKGMHETGNFSFKLFNQNGDLVAQHALNVN